MSDEKKPTFNNPLLKSVKEKAYSAPNVSIDPTQLNAPIPEPTFIPEPIDMSQDLYSKIGDDQPEQGPITGTMPGPGMSSMHSLPDEETEEGAENLANLILNGYVELNTWAEKGLRISQRRINKLQQEGIINLGALLEVKGNIVTAADVIDDYNEQTKGTFEVTKEFKKETKPVLKRVLQKRGAKLTDEQMLMYLFGKDIAMKTVVLFQMKAQTNELIEAIRMSSEQAKGANPVPPNQPQTAASNPPVPPTPSFSESYVQHSGEMPFTNSKEISQKRKKLDKQIAAATQGYAPNSYEQAVNSRKTGKRGRKKKETPQEFIDEATIAEQIQIEESHESEELGMD